MSILLISCKAYGDGETQYQITGIDMLRVLHELSIPVANRINCEVYVTVYGEPLTDESRKDNYIEERTADENTDESFRDFKRWSNEQISILLDHGDVK